MRVAIGVVERFVSGYQTGGDEGVADDFLDYTSLPGFGTGAMLRAGFPDPRAEVVEQFAQGEMVEFLGIPATGRAGKCGSIGTFWTPMR